MGAATRNASAVTETDAELVIIEREMAEQELQKKSHDMVGHAAAAQAGRADERFGVSAKILLTVLPLAGSQNGEIVIELFMRGPLSLFSSRAIAA